MRPVLSAALAAVVLLAASAVPSAAAAETHTVAPAGGGLAALDVSVDLGRGVVNASGVEIPIAIEHGALPAEGAVTVETIPVGQGKRVVHVRVPLKDSEGEDAPAWEAVLAGGRKDPIFAGMTGPTTGDPGERVGKAVQVVPNGATSFVLVGDTREDLRICGQSVTLLDPLALYPSSLQLRPATVQRLSAEQREGAESIVATAKASGEAPLAQLLVARGSSVPGSRGVELTDGDPQTVWRELRPGIGQGEFVVMAAPKGVPIPRVQITVSPPVLSPTSPNPAASASAAAPRTLYLVTTVGAFEVTLPTDGAAKPGATYEVVFPKPLETSCMTLVLGGAYTRGLAHPDVGVAELTAFSEFDAPGATLDDLAKSLSGPRGLAAAQALERAGAPALPAVAAAYDGLDSRGRALAIDVAASHESCDEAAALLARGLCETEGEAPRKAHEKLERCKGAGPALAARLRDDAASRACVAPVLATIAPEAALEPIADAMAATAEDDRATRAVLRQAFGAALAGTPPGRLAPLLGDRQRSPAARLEMMRAAAGRLNEAPAQSAANLAELLAGAPPMRSRFLALGPLSELARGGDRAAAVRIEEAAVHDPDGPVRSRAAELSSGLPDAPAVLAAAARDPEPRVREAALGSLAATGSPPPDAVRAGVDALGHDGWWFVKAQAVAMLAGAPATREVDDALGEALHDPSVNVRGAAVVALARRRAVAWRSTVAERLDDTGEDLEVRGAAARALGALCDGDSADRLSELVRALGSSATDPDAQQLGFAALVGLAALHPPDLQRRVAALLAPGAPPYARAAAQRALAARGMCK
jgi:HEAT repeats